MLLSTNFQALIKVFLRTPIRELLQTPLILLHFLFAVKKRRNWHRHDYSEIDDGSKVKDDKRYSKIIHYHFCQILTSTMDVCMVLIKF